MYFHYFVLSPLGKGHSPSFEVWLKLALCFLRRRFLHFVNALSLFCNYLPLKEGGPFIWTHLISLHLRMLVPSLVEIGPAVLEKKMKMWFFILSIYFRCFVIILDWKRAWPFLWTNLIFHHLKWLSRFYFVRIRPPDFLCNEFFIKMYRILQNYTFEICIY